MEMVSADGLEETKVDDMITPSSLCDFSASEKESYSQHSVFEAFDDSSFLTKGVHLGSTPVQMSDYEFLLLPQSLSANLQSLY